MICILSKYQIILSQLLHRLQFKSIRIGIFFAILLCASFVTRTLDFYNQIVNKDKVLVKKMVQIYHGVLNSMIVDTK